MIPQLQKCIDYFREEILNKVNADFWVAGGALKDYFIYGNTKNSVDIDLYFPDDNNFQKVKRYLENQGYENNFESDNSLKMKKDNTVFDLVKIFQRDPKLTIYFFDFTVCCCAVDKYGIYHHESFFIDALQRRLVINDIQKPFNSLSRMRKYIMKGFFMDNENLFKLMRAIRETPANQVPSSILNIENIENERILGEITQTQNMHHISNEQTILASVPERFSIGNECLFNEASDEEALIPICESNNRTMEINQCNQLAPYS